MGTEQHPYAKVIALAASDDDFRERLQETPHTALAEHGIDVPQDREIKVVENTDEILYLVLPAAPQGDLSEEDLAKVFGGVGPGIGIPTTPF